MYTAYILHLDCIYIAYTLHIRCIYTAYTLHIHSAGGPLANHGQTTGKPRANPQANPRANPGYLVQVWVCQRFRI